MAEEDLDPIEEGILQGYESGIERLEGLGEMSPDVDFNFVRGVIRSEFENESIAEINKPTFWNKMSEDLTIATARRRRLGFDDSEIVPKFRAHVEASADLLCLRHIPSTGA
jgi:hypothetical protein